MPVRGHRIGRMCGNAALAASLLLMGALSVHAEEDAWPSLKQGVFGDRTIEAEDGMVVLDAPLTAEDAATVPVTV